jgi:N-acetylglutamate synthase-like GNAT family acetyltransferase
LLDEGISVVAAEPGNYFMPGVPLSDEGARAFFRGRGFGEGAVTWNLDVELGERQVFVAGRSSPAGGPSPSQPGLSRAEGRLRMTGMADVRRPSHDEAERVLAFVEQAFGWIWRFEAAKAFERELPPAFIAEEDGQITGFAVHDVNNRGLGWFGPTGVDPGMRGRGVGGRLLLASLADLQRLGYARAVIPWTDALDFYRKVAGANPAQQFVSMQR